MTLLVIARVYWMVGMVLLRSCGLLLLGGF